MSRFEAVHGAASLAIAMPQLFGHARLERTIAAVPVIVARMAELGLRCDLLLNNAPCLGFVAYVGGDE